MIVEIFAVWAILLSSPSIQQRYVDPFYAQLLTGARSLYYWVITAGTEAAKVSPVLGIRQATFRDPCPEVIEVSAELDCGNHPNNY